MVSAAKRALNGARHDALVASTQTWRMKMKSKTNVGPMIDELGMILAQKADLEAREKSIKAQLKEHGDGEFEGRLFRATVATAERSTLDMKAVREHLSPQFIAAHTNVANVTTVKVVARNGRIAA